jgi:hypothetical protein
MSVPELVPEYRVKLPASWTFFGHESWLISALENGYAFGIRLRISSNLFSASASRFIPAS